MNVFITGGTSGIGLELVKHYLDAGHRVALTGRNLTKIESEDFFSHPRLSCYQVDVKDREQMKKVIVEFAQSHGDLDLVVANAGRSVGPKSSTPNFELGREVVEINLLGVMNTFGPSLEAMLPNKKGQLVAISSVAGFIGLPGASFYSASKAGVSMICESLSVDLKNKGISVSCICPGFIDTPLTQQNDHKMPFLMDAPAAAKRIARAIERKKALSIFPWPMCFIITILRLMPRGLYRFVMGLKFIDYRNRLKNS